MDLTYCCWFFCRRDQYTCRWRVFAYLAPANFLGLPPAVANGTNRIAILFQTASSIAGFKSKGITAFPFALYLGASALIGSLLGAQIAIDIKGPPLTKFLLWSCSL